jgi:hypothetical protein
MNLKTNFLKNIRGITIVEMLIALALVSIIALMVSQLTVQQSTNSANITDSFEVSEFVIRIGESIRNKEACEQTFKDIDMPLSGTPVPISIIRNSNVVAGTGGIVYDASVPSTGSLSYRVTVGSLTLTPFNDNAANAAFSTDLTSGVPNLYRLQLNLYFLKKNGASPPIMTRRTIPFIARTSNTAAGKIYSCFAEENSWYQEICSTMLTGQYQEQNTTLQRFCTDFNIKNSVSTDGHFCLNQLTTLNTGGNIHSKDCINSWYAGWAQSYGGAACVTTGGGCPADNVVVGVSVSSCGKNCVSSKSICCPIRLRK